MNLKQKAQRPSFIAKLSHIWMEYSFDARVPICKLDKLRACLLLWVDDSYIGLIDSVGGMTESVSLRDDV